MKILDIILNKPTPVVENATAGATSSSTIATSIPGGGAGFGNSIFMKRVPLKKKRKN